jgi:2-polyprenyl-6-methoxyphenol hydroxylase-like FAD-dependent oxidoreductase
MTTSIPVDALIVGAGPTGLMLAGVLLRRGLRVRLIDAAPAPSPYSRAIGIQSRTLESLDLLGLADAFVAAGLPLRGASFASAGHEIGEVSFDSLDTRFPFLLSLPQTETERLLADWIEGMGGQIERGVTLDSLAQAEVGGDAGEAPDAPIIATLRHTDGASEQTAAAWLIGCDGAHSRTRHLVGATFRGAAYPETFALADVRIAWQWTPDQAHIFFHPDGLLAAFPLPGDRYRLILDTARGPSASTDAPSDEASHPPAPTLDEVAAIVARRSASDAKLSDARWLASFRISARSVNHTRFGRVFLVGDAAHIHSPAGGQGMNTGIQDAINLGWKLALTQRGLAHDALLDSYERERRPIAEDVLLESDALLRAATLRNPLVQRARDGAFSLLTSLSVVERRLVRQIAEVTINYRRSPLTAPTQLSRAAAIGARVRPGDYLRDVDDLRAPDGQPTRLCELLRGGASLLLAFPSATGLTREQMRELGQAIQPWGDALAAYRVAPSLIISQAADASDPLPTLADAKGALRRAFGLAGEGDALLVIRPDGYLGLHAEGAGAVEVLRGYTARVLGERRVTGA